MRCLPSTITTAYTIHIIRFTIIADIPNVIIKSLKNGTATAVSLPGVACFCASSLLKKINNKKATLHTMANLEKKAKTFMKKFSLAIPGKIILFWQY